MSDWAPFAVRWDGNPDKIGYPGIGRSGPKRGAVLHSAEGKSWQVIHDLLTTAIRRSWTFTIGYDRIEQHYPYRSHCWHAGDIGDDGGVRANIDLVGIEALGVAGEPLTPFQFEAEIRILRWCAEQEGQHRFARYPEQVGVWTLAEHNEVSDEPTACPSGRIPWAELLAQLNKEEDEMDSEARAWLKAASIFLRAAAHAAEGRPLPADLKAAIRFLTQG